MEYDRPDQIGISPMSVALAQAAAEEAEYEQSNRFNPYYIDSDELIVEDRPGKLPVADESIMSTKKKFNLILSNKFYGKSFSFLLSR